MLPTLRTLAPFGLLLQHVKGWRGDGDDARSTHVNRVNSTTIYDPICTANVTVYDTTSVQVTHYVDYTVNITKTNTCTESTTTTFHYTVSVTETDSATIIATETHSVMVTNTATHSTTITNTEVDSVTVTNTETDWTTATATETDLATITNTEIDSVTITNTETDLATITTYTTRTIFSTTYDPCPKSCSVSAETVNLYFWPTDRPYTYPSTYVDRKLSYTFTSPSVYMLIPTAQGINTLGEPAGPSTTSWILPLDLYEVSTIAYGSNVTRQLTLSDLGTDCPQTADPTAIATMVDSHCDPILAAPSQVRSWAYPCNACGRFGLFDPPYAVPTLTGGLLGPGPTTVTAAPVTVTAAPIIQTLTLAPPPPVQTGVLLIAYYDSDGKPLSTATITTTGISGTVTSSVLVPATTAGTGTSGTEIVVPTPGSSETNTGSEEPLSPPTTASPSTPSLPGAPFEPSTSTTVVTASATRFAATGGFIGMWMISSIFVALF